VLNAERGARALRSMMAGRLMGGLAVADPGQSDGAPAPDTSYSAALHAHPLPSLDQQVAPAPLFSQQSQPQQASEPHQQLDQQSGNQPPSLDQAAMVQQQLPPMVQQQQQQQQQYSPPRQAAMAMAEPLGPSSLTDHPAVPGYLS